MQYIPDVSRAVFGLLTAMQKRAAEREEDGVPPKRPKFAVGATAKVGSCAFFWKILLLRHFGCELSAE